MYSPQQITAGKKVNIKIIVEYDGSAYFGWQRQKDKPSIQQKIEDALKILFPGEKITLTGAGRTDTGVHAYNQCANFKISAEKFRDKGILKLKYSLNALLPGDIVIKSVKKVNDKFHSRYSAKKREYIYRFSVNEHAICRNYVYFIRQEFDAGLANKFCRTIKGIHCFKALCKNREDDHDFKCKVLEAGIKRRAAGIYEFRITANRFLHSMVRAVVGAMLKVSSGSLPHDEFTRKFKKGDEIKIQYVPSNALFLSKVTY